MNRRSRSNSLSFWVSLPVMALFILVSAGCTMIPKYQRPPSNIATSYPAVPGYKQTIAAPAKIPAADIGWRDFFRDPRLQEIIELALTNNPNLLAAVLNMEQSRALYHVQALALVPTVDVNASGTRQRIPNVFGGQSKPLVYTEYDANLGLASYEVDLFGQVRSLKRQALETYFATVEAQQSAQIALVAQVGTAYLSDEEAAEELSLSQEMLAAARQSYDLTRRSFEAGVSSQFDLNNASAQLQTASTAVASYAQQLAEASDNLTLLAGKPLPEELRPSSLLNPGACLTNIPAGLPSDLLERRPDVLEAEHQLKAANADIGAARAAFFPTITLTGNAGFSSTALDNLFTPGSTAFGFTPQLVWPIFNGTSWQEYKAIKAADRIAAANYQSAVQTAFKETADALAVRETVESQLADAASLVNTDEQSYQMTRAGFRSGVNSQLDVLVTLQTLDSAKLNLIQTRYSCLISLINIYQALGGGWTDKTVQPR
jgi:multidrug efflux system outer membrane protein